MMLATIEDEQERLAIEDIYIKHRHKLLAIALKLTKNQQVAEDAVGDTFVEIIERKEKIFSLNGSEMLPYIVTIVKSRAINILKKDNRIHDKPIEEWELEFESADTPVDEQVIDQMGYDKLVALISRLCESQRIVFEMRYIQFLTNDEIAEELGFDAKTVENRLYKAKLKLRKLLENEEARANG